MRLIKSLFRTLRRITQTIRADLRKLGDERLRMDHPVPGSAVTTIFETGERVPYNQLEMSARNARRLARRKERT